MVEQKRYIITGSCGKCPNSRQKGDAHWYCNAPGRTPWETVLDGKPILPDKIPEYCPLPVHHSSQTEREKVLDIMCKKCPLLDERPDICENCLVEATRKELRSKGGEQE